MVVFVVSVVDILVEAAKDEEWREEEEEGDDDDNADDEEGENAGVPAVAVDEEKFDIAVAITLIWVMTEVPCGVTTVDVVAGFVVVVVVVGFVVVVVKQRRKLSNSQPAVHVRAHAKAHSLTTPCENPTLHAVHAVCEQATQFSPRSVHGLSHFAPVNDVFWHAMQSPPLISQPRASHVTEQVSSQFFVITTLVSTNTKPLP